MGIASRVRRRLRTSGLYWKLHAAYRDAIDGRFDRQYGIDTRGMIHAEQLGSGAPLPAQSWGYMGTPPREFAQLVSALAIRPADYAFVDIGSGKGRVAFLAAMHGFAPITGVELSPELHEVAQRNRAVMNAAGAFSVEPEFLNIDALDYEFPSVPIVIYAYNPFKEEAMREFAERIAKSHEAAPRHILFVYRNATCARVFDLHPLFEPLVRHTEKTPPTMRIYQIPA
jgi:SAM-dependent methyltransferase